MTIKEKQIRKKVREDLRDKGILPPPKKRLDRRAFAQEVLRQYDELGNFSLYPDLLEAIVYMVPESSVTVGVTSEQVGVLKMLKMAMDLHDAKRKAAKEGREINHLDLWNEVIKPIWNL